MSALLGGVETDPKAVSADSEQAAPAELDTFVGALIEATDQLLGLYQLVSIGANPLERHQAVRHILEHALEPANCVAGLVVGLEDGCTVVGDGLGLSAGRAAEFGVDEGSLSAIADDVRNKLPVGNSMSLVAPSGASCLVVPVPGRANKVALVLVRGPGGRFTTVDVKLAAAVADIVGAAITTSELHERALTNAVVESEHRAASTLAQAVLPRRPPFVKGFSVFAKSTPARTAGGDFFAHQASIDGLRAVVGDVSGKGLPAAILMTNCVSSANAAFGRTVGAGSTEVVAELERDLFDFLDESARFVTVVGLSLSPAGVVEFTNAGHSPVVVVTESGAEVVAPGSPPLGVVPGCLSSGPAWSLAPGDLVFVGSDGITEQRNPEGRLFGTERLESTLVALRGQPAAAVAAGVEDALSRFASGCEPDDDLTMFVIAREVDR